MENRSQDITIHQAIGLFPLRREQGSNSLIDSSSSTIHSPKRWKTLMGEMNLFLPHELFVHIFSVSPAQRARSNSSVTVAGKQLD